MSTTPDPSPCPRWCEASQHLGNHRRHLGELILPERTRARILSVTIEGSGVGEPWPVLSITTSTYREPPDLSIAMTWPEARRLAGLLHEAAQRFE